MNFSEAAKAVLESFGKAWHYRWPFLIVFVMVRLLVLAIVFPVANLILSVAIATRDQSALTDQDIALFLLCMGKKRWLARTGSTGKLATAMVRAIAATPVVPSGCTSALGLSLSDSQC